MTPRYPARERLVTPLDIALLQAVANEGSLVAASRALGISRDRGVYRLGRLARIAGRAVVLTRKGGPTPGGTRLTAEGHELLARGVGPAAVRGGERAAGEAKYLTGVWHARPEPHVEVSPSFRLVVAFRAEEGSTVRVAVDPAAILVSRRLLPTSARNVVAGTVRRIAKAAGWQRTVDVRVGTEELPVALTPSAVRSLRLRRGTPVRLYVKATSIRRA